MTLTDKNILYEDKDIIVCNKPAGIAAQTAKLGETDMVSLVRNYLRTPYIGLVHRLDQPVEGILLLAKTQAAAADLSRQFLDKSKVEKHYYALVLEEGNGADEEVYRLTDYLLKDGRSNTSRVVSSGMKDAKKAELEYKLCSRLPVKDFMKLASVKSDMPAVDDGMEADGKNIALADIFLKTGRHHQIRVQMSHAGMPLLGDKKYGSDESTLIADSTGIRDIALCAYYLSFCHPVTKKKINFTITPANPAFIPFLPVTP